MTLRSRVHDVNERRRPVGFRITSLIAAIRSGRRMTAGIKERRPEIIPTVVGRSSARSYTIGAELCATIGVSIDD